jgi:hypothetical protein
MSRSLARRLLLALLAALALVAFGCRPGIRSQHAVVLHAVGRGDRSAYA